VVNDVCFSRGFITDTITYERHSNGYVRVLNGFARD
jgi:hypothetical protein